MESEDKSNIKVQETKEKKGFWRRFTDGLSDVIDFILEIFSKT